MKKRASTSTSAKHTDLPKNEKRQKKIKYEALVQGEKAEDSTTSPQQKQIIFEKQAPIEEIASHFRTYGYVVIRALDKDQCIANIKRQVTDVLLKQPWAERLIVRDPATKQPLDIERDTERYIAELTRPNLSKETLAHYRSVWPFHAGFGACCDDSVFHLPEVWRIREDPYLYSIASALIGRVDLWVDINRGIQKLPGEGEEEFLHWDFPFLYSEHTESDSVHGKVMFTDGSFVCVPGTSTKEFQEQFKTLYGPLYPNAKPNDAKFGLDQAKADPLDLASKRATIHVPAGCAIFWSKRLLHGVKRNPKATGHIQFGTYLGYMPPVDREAYRKRALVGELEDRIHSFREGVAPKLWPSLDRIHYYPARYVNFHRMLQPYIDKTPSDYPGLTTRTIKSGPKAGTVVQDIIPVRPRAAEDYTPPTLSVLGQRLLGLVAW